MYEWVNWSESFRAPVNRIEQPGSLANLQAVVQSVTNVEGRVHAEGTRWAFSAPAYCEDTVIDTQCLNGFPETVQRSILQPDRQPNRLLVAVEAGIKIHDLYRAIAFDNPSPGDFRGYLGPRPALPPELTDGRIWTLPVLGGAGGQSLAGAINTGTHGGDVARSPLSDAVRAMLLISTGGELLLFEPDPGQGPLIIDETRLSLELGQHVGVRRDSDLFNAALVSVGRFGVVWVYVIEVHDETGVAIVETRTQSTWEAIRTGLVADVMGAAFQDDFLQVVINPYQATDHSHACYITRHAMVPGHPTDPDISPRLHHVTHARNLSLVQVAFQALGSDDPVQFVSDVKEILHAAGPPFELILVPYAMERFGHCGHIRPNGARYLVGDAMADILELLTSLGRGDVIAAIARRILDVEQRDQLAGPLHGPWIVKGTRFEIADFYDYNGPAYRGDSVELFFPVNPVTPDELPSTIDAILRVFDVLRAEGQAIGAYVSLRFMASTRAILGLAKWSPTCSVEVAMLRGLRGNDRALRLLQEVCMARAGLVHWGQQHDLEPRDVEVGFGLALTAWRNQLSSLHGRDLLFSSPFTRARNLEVTPPVDWEDWIDLGQVGRGGAALPDGFMTSSLMEVFARDDRGIIKSRRLNNDGTPAGPWFTVRPEPMQGRPTVFRGISGRLELFIIDNGFLKHTYQETVSGTTWSAWDVKGFPAPIRYDNDERPIVAVTTHSDGRLETFGRASWVDEHRLAHCWANNRDSWGWNTVWHRGSISLAGPPSATNRRLPDGRDHLVVVATNTRGSVQSMHQVDPADNAGWTDWQPLDPGITSIGNRGAVVVTPTTGSLHVFTIGPHDRVYFTVDTSVSLTPSWGAWTELDLEVDPQSRLAVVATASRIWVAARTLRREVAVWDFAPGSMPYSRFLHCLTADDVALGVYPGEDAVYVAVRSLDGRLFGRRVLPSA